MSLSLAWKNACVPTWTSAGWWDVCQCLWNLSLYIAQASQLFPSSFNFWSVCSQVAAQAKNLNAFSISFSFISYASQLMGHAEFLMENLEMSKRNFGIFMLPEKNLKQPTKQKKTSRYLFMYNLIFFEGFSVYKGASFEPAGVRGSSERGWMYSYCQWISSNNCSSNVEEFDLFLMVSKIW